MSPFSLHSIFQLILLLVILSKPTIQKTENKYSKELNSGSIKNEEVEENRKFKDLTNPFRMNKINVIWEKALHRLAEPKLKSLYGELKVQDKDEIKLKRLRADGGDKDGLMEADVRKKLKGILKNYSLSNLFDGEESKDGGGRSSSDSHYNQLSKKLFKDKKLNRLWEKAEKSGFTEVELKALKEEFSHHQDKLDEYYGIMESLTAEEKNLMHNDIPDVNSLLDEELSEEGLDPSMKRKTDSKYNKLVGSHRELKQSYDKLHRKTLSGSDGNEFSEPRVQQLWKIALEGSFSPEELDSLRTELKHYEKRIDKLNHIQAEYLLKSQFKDKKDPYHHTDKDRDTIFEDKIKRHERVVEKLHGELEEKVRRRHSEL